jgi:hypothetical protein
MAKRKIEIYQANYKEVDAMVYCVKRNVAYSLEANTNKRFYIVKYIPSDYKNVIYLKENNKKVEFSEYEATKKIMELYINQSKLI